MTVTGIVLAGGRASRFGGPKLRADLEGTTILHRAIAAVAAVADEVLVAGPELPAEGPGAPSRAAVPVRLVEDADPFGGPLAALAGALGEARRDIALVVGGDMPRLEPAVLGLMVARVAVDPGVDAVVLGAPARNATGGAGRVGPQQVLPLAVRVVPAIAAAREALDAGERSLHALFRRLAHDEVPPASWLAADPAAMTLLDVDTPADLERLRAAAPGPHRR